MTPQQEKQIQDMDRMLKRHSMLLSVAIKKIESLEKSNSSLKTEIETLKRQIKK